MPRGGLREPRPHPVTDYPLLGWRRGVVVSGIRCMNEVNACRARLVPLWELTCHIG